jgi:hypothetical protein
MNRATNVMLVLMQIGEITTSSINQRQSIGKVEIVGI